MKNSETAPRRASEIAMLSGRHCRLSGKDAHARRNPPNNSSSTRILQVHHAPRQNGVTRLVPTVRTAVGQECWLTIVSQEAYGGNRPSLHSRSFRSPELSQLI